MVEKYSVLMSLYKKENPNWFVESIESMINQSVKPNQIVLVIDGPISGELKDKVTFFQENYSDLIDVLPLEKNIGLGKALDKGLEICSNELVARMDTDDISLPDRCEKELKLFDADSQLAMVGTNIDEFYDTPDNIVSSRNVPSKNEDIKKYIRRRSPFNHPTVMFKKSVVIEVGGYGTLRRKQDLDLFSRMVNSGYKTANLDESLLLFRSNENNFKRRKSWSYVSSYIKAQYTIFRRGHCNLLDLLYVIVGQIILYILPLPLLKQISNKFLRSVK
ncbi:glycosyltransferase [Aerococcus agrisoli]|uniref:Glycosyltransferase n=1 Tax=Aerococcus agrisoli TaxID=2487350 RepID=A0A3N4GD34_9LACT|nr:glycosyltransferase [Aerococcus agrisoli]RPA60692.1 glycosyltransferase [Aerococcus agrisoli]